MASIFGGSFEYMSTGCAVSSSRWMRIFAVFAPGTTRRTASWRMAPERMMSTRQMSRSGTTTALPVVSVPQGVYRGFRYIGEGKGTLLTIIGGPDAGKVEWHPSVMEEAAKAGWHRNEQGELVRAAAE